MESLCLKDSKASKSLASEALPTTKNNVNCEALNTGVHRDADNIQVQGWPASKCGDHQFPHKGAPVCFKKGSGKELSFCYTFWNRRDGLHILKTKEAPKPSDSIFP